VDSVTSNKRIGLFGAFERHNFGDWLMAWIAEKLLAGTAECDWLVDFPHFGNGINPACGSFSRLDEYLGGAETTSVLHTGGETLGCSVGDAIAMSSQEPQNRSRPLFYVLSDQEAGSHPRRFFFGVGGQDLSHLNEETRRWLGRTLATATWVSVRDSRTQRNLGELGVSSSLHPDLVSLISQIFTLSVEQNRERTLLVQASESYLAENSTEFCRQVRALSEIFDDVVVAVAGIASHHDSFASALSIVSSLRSNGVKRVRLLCELDPLQIAREIGSAALVIATSLHFRIISMAYGVPRVSLGPKKTKNYAAEWDILPLFADSPAEIPSVAEAALRLSSSELEARGQDLAREVFSAWSLMLRELR
jgi:hypothetical protein